MSSSTVVPVDMVVQSVDCLDWSMNVPRDYEPPVFGSCGAYNTILTGDEFYLIMDRLGISPLDLSRATGFPQTSILFWRRSKQIPTNVALTVRHLQKLTNGIINALDHVTSCSFHNCGYRFVGGFWLPESWWRMCVARSAERTIMKDFHYSHKRSR